MTVYQDAVRVAKDKTGKFRFTLIDPNRQTITLSEGYANKVRILNGTESVKSELFNNHRTEKEIVGIIKQTKRELQQALEFAESVVSTVHEPILLLDAGLRIVWANNSFYKLFLVKPQDTKGMLIYEIGKNQWDIPKLQELLQERIANNTSINDFKIECDFPQIGRCVMILNARHIYDGKSKTYRILLTIKNISEGKCIEQKKTSSELRYRRLFETAQDGILILDAETGQITDVNPFLIDMLGYSKDEFLGKRLWEIGAFMDSRRSREAYRKLQKNGYIRYEDLPLKTKNGQKREVEFVSNAYLENDERVIQCNIRDISERKQLERNLAFAATHDIVTGLPNRMLFNDHYNLALAGAKRYHKKLAIAVLDIDHFKDINDTFGHHYGDELLKEFGNRLCSIVRKTDTVARIGGDEFALLMTEVIEIENITNFAQKILANVRKPFVLNDRKVRIAVSIGISNYPDDGEDVEILIKYADTAMYQVKNNGRNNYLRYRPCMVLQK
jgi:diguanylate cyclase (GGDEF)-like protein/PAS domain S-box-containing protein